MTSKLGKLEVNCQRVFPRKTTKNDSKVTKILKWWREQDSNLQSSGYEPDELPIALSRGATVTLSEFCFFVKIEVSGFLYLLGNMI
jgi:hypothetical protein